MSTDTCDGPRIHTAVATETSKEAFGRLRLSEASGGLLGGPENIRDAVCWETFWCDLDVERQLCKESSLRQWRWFPEQRRHGLESWDASGMPAEFLQTS